ncbi:hypothetical protein [Modestobacter sp. NPDC049651]|uniref:hypothetical protein n=1 Tax=unclassified Modestobacter TaxID=2643866 RepID=UPI0033FA982A
MSVIEHKPPTTEQITRPDVEPDVVAPIAPEPAAPERVTEHPVMEKLGLEERPWLFLVVGVLAVVLAFAAMLVLTVAAGGGNFPPAG